MNVGKNMLVSDELTAIRFFKHDQLPERELIGYDLQIKAGMGIGLAAARGSGKKALVFGLPGTGVRAFPNAVAWSLNSEFDLRLSLLCIDFEDLLLGITNGDGNIPDALRKSEEIISVNKPIIVQVDGLDMLNLTDGNFRSSKSVATCWARRFLNRNDNRTAVFCVTNYPLRLGSGSARACIPIYLDVTDLELVERIISHMLVRSDSEYIAGRLWNSLKRFGLQPVSGEISHACQELKSKHTTTVLDGDKAVDFLQSNIAPTHLKQDVAKYKETNAGLIALSKDFSTPFWAKQLDEYRESERS